jgi:hypothetical protein
MEPVVVEDGMMLVTVANFTEPWEAHMFRTRLRAAMSPLKSQA